MQTTRRKLIRSALAAHGLAAAQLELGDIIYTGTLGATKKMNPGDVFEVELEGVGVLRNPVKAA